MLVVSREDHHDQGVGRRKESLRDKLPKDQFFLSSRVNSGPNLAEQDVDGMPAALSSCAASPATREGSPAPPGRFIDPNYLHPFLEERARIS
jgi:hypothetical protein